MIARVYEFEGIRLVLSKSGIVPLNRRYRSEARSSLWRRHTIAILCGSSALSKPNLVRKIWPM
jgi:hypothetical protein